CMALASGAVAAPTSPMPPERESGAIIRKGAAVTMELICFPSAWVPPPISCADAYGETAASKTANVTLRHIPPVCKLHIDITTKSTKNPANIFHEIFYTFVRLL